MCAHYCIHLLPACSAEGEHPDHTVVIKYVPAVGDSKVCRGHLGLGGIVVFIRSEVQRALDEYSSRIFMGGNNTISMHNTCEVCDPHDVATRCTFQLIAGLAVGRSSYAGSRTHCRAVRTPDRCVEGSLQKIVAEHASPFNLIVRRASEPETTAARMHPVCSLLSYMLKAPMVSDDNILSFL
jgi:hypothetical protein